MAGKITEWLNASVVLIGRGLLASDEELHAFGNQIQGEVRIQTLMNPDDSPGLRRIVISKHRVTVDTIAERSSILREHPDEDWPRLAEISRLALEASNNLEIDAYGYNVALVYEQDSASTAYEYIADRVLRAPDIAGWSLRGGTAELRFYDDDERRWTVSVAPRFEQENTRRLYFSLNLHVGGTALGADEVKSQLDSVRDQAILFVEALG